MLCKTHLVDCLRRKGVKPVASSKCCGTNAYTQNGIDYTDNNRFVSSYDVGDQWWMIDFKRDVYVSSYIIKIASVVCNFVNIWDITLSKDGSQWTNPVSSNKGYPSEDPYFIHYMQYVRYFRINGNSTNGCTNNQNALAFLYIKVFGSYRMSSLRCNNRNRLGSLNFCLIIIISS